MNLLFFFSYAIFAEEILDSFEETDFYEDFAPKIFYSQNAQNAYVSSYEQPFGVDESSEYFTEYSQYGEAELNNEYFVPNSDPLDLQVLFETSEKLARKF
jgi:hypothetical protein